MWEICDVQPFLLLLTVLDLRLLFRKPYYVVGPYLLSLLDAGIARQGLITQVSNNTNQGPVDRGGSEKGDSYIAGLGTRGLEKRRPARKRCGKNL